MKISLAMVRQLGRANKFVDVTGAVSSALLSGPNRSPNGIRFDRAAYIAALKPLNDV
jgi:hypothetical protein